MACRNGAAQQGASLNVTHLNHHETILPTHPGPWKNCLTRNHSLVPKIFETTALGESFHFLLSAPHCLFPREAAYVLVWGSPASLGQVLIPSEEQNHSPGRVTWATSFSLGSCSHGSPRLKGWHACPVWSGSARTQPGILGKAQPCDLWVSGQGSPGVGRGCYFV